MTERESLYPFRCHLGFHRLVRLYTAGWFDRCRCSRCGREGWAVTP